MPEITPQALTQIFLFGLVLFLLFVVMRDNSLLAKAIPPDALELLRSQVPHISPEAIAWLERKAKETPNKVDDEIVAQIRKIVEAHLQDRYKEDGASGDPHFDAVRNVTIPMSRDLPDTSVG